MFRKLILLLIFTVILYAQEERVVNVSVLNIRSAPTTNSEVIGKLQKGQKVEVLEWNKGWAKVRIGNTVGYVYGSYLSELVNTKIIRSNAGKKLLKHLQENFWIYLIVSAVFLIGAFVVHSQNIATVFTSWKDLLVDAAILILPVGYGLYYLFFQSERDIAFSENIHSYILVLVSFVSVVILLVRIAQNNKFDIFRTLVAFILTFPIILEISIVMTLLLLLVALLFFFWLFGGNSKDRRYRRRSLISGIFRRL